MNTIKTIRVVILKNEDPFDHSPWVIACENVKSRIEYHIIDLTKSVWLEKLKQYSPDICLLKPSGKTSLFRQLYQERVEIIAKDMNYRVFPSYDEIRIYENKRYFSYWAKANNVSHPQTWVFYHKNEANNFTKSYIYPIVAKLNIGASGNGVRVIKSEADLNSYINKAFAEGVASRTGPKIGKGNLLGRFWDKITHPSQLVNRLKTYSQIASDKQKGFVILQEFISHNFEWRVVRIGDSFFAHKKIKIGEKASGTLKKEYENPPHSLFDFTKQLTDKFNFRSVAVDVFEESEGSYLVNEIQCIFGQSDPYQMLVDGKPGRYKFENNQWVFEEGDFNQNQSYNLRLEYILSHQL